jgi:DNA polymerase-1
MGAYALSKSLEIKQKEAQSLIDQYLDAYPELKKWMKWSNEFAIKNGYIKNKVGRIRHLNNLKRVCDAFGNMAEQLLDYNFRKELSRKYPEEQVMSAYRDYKNGLNNAKNFQIQSLAASVVNRAGLGVMREFKKEGIDGYPVAQIHDQWIFGVPKEQKQRAFEIVQYVMENETDVGIPLKAPPEFAYNWRDGH